MPDVILVDENDKPVGTMEKIAAHEQGLLHRAFSVFIFDRKGMMLLQKRATHKYHSPGLWTNACCSHPFPGEEIQIAAIRRLNEELGFNTTLKKAFHFTYKASFENGLTEFEFDHVFAGFFEGEIKPDPEEVADTCYKSVEAIESDMKSNPEQYTEWFKIAFPLLQEWLQKHQFLHVAT
jgi:isopentenyl-diphosphate Delta-isomerase